MIVIVYEYGLDNVIEEVVLVVVYVVENYLKDILMLVVLRRKVYWL